MRRSFFPQSSPFQSSPKRRRIDTRPVSSSQGSRAGVIDQRLIEGSQHLPISSSFPRGSVLSEQIPSSTSEDSPLDAFGGSRDVSEHQLLTTYRS